MLLILCPSEYKKLNGENYKNCNRLEKTSYWTYSTIKVMLQNELYIGNMVQGKKHQRMRSKQRPVEKENWIRVENTHEPIIDRQLWDKVTPHIYWGIHITICVNYNQHTGEVIREKSG